MTEILVRGEAEVRTMPDRATIRVTVDGDGESRDAAYEAAAQLAKSVDGVLDDARDALDRVTTTSMFVQPKTRWHKGEQQRTGWRAARTSVVEMTDLSLVGELLARVAGAGGAISGPSWELDPGHSAHDAARREAAEDARRRAETYSAALGLTINEVAWVSEPGMRLAGVPIPAGGMALAGVRRSARAEEDEPMNVSPEEITVRCVIEVAFEAQG